MVSFGLLSQLGLTREISKTALGFSLSSLNLILGAILLILSAILYISRYGFSFLVDVKFKKKAIWGLSIIFYSMLFVLLLVLANYAARRTEFFRYDSTEQKVFTLSPQTEQLLDSINQRVEIKAFYVAGDVEEKTRDLLDRLSRKNPFISWSILDPEKNTTIVEKYGISKPNSLVLLSGFPQDGAGDASRRVLVEDQIDEESLANGLIKLVRPKVHKLYYLSGEGEADLNSAEHGGYNQFKQALEAENVVLRPLVLSDATSIPADVDCLLVLAPQALFLPQAVEKLKKYLDNGGRALVLAEPRTSNNLPELLSAYGVNIGNNVIVDFPAQNPESKELGIQPVVSDFASHPIFKGFNRSLVFSSVSSVQAAASLPEGVKVVELAFSSKYSWAETNTGLLFSDAPQAQKDDTDIPGPVPVAVAVTKKSSGAGDSPELRMVVVGDVDFASNVALSKLFNRDFLLNSVNWLLGIDEGVTIRSRTMRESRESISTGQFSMMYLITVIAIPEVFLLLGLFVWWRRKNIS